MIREWRSHDKVAEAAGKSIHPTDVSVEEIGRIVGFAAALRVEPTKHVGSVLR